jgi:outer membrane protein OmpA-like peptidoglycan-associated protein
MKKLINSSLLLFMCFSFVNAQNAADVEGCKDHPLLSRMQNYLIGDCKNNYDQIDFVNAAGEDVKEEGNLTYIWYVFNTESGANEPSFFQILKNYSTAILKIGGKKNYQDDGSAFFELKKNGKEYKIAVRCVNSSDIMLHILEMEPMVQEITANAMLDALNKDGSIALNILFETGKSAIDAGSLPIVDQIFEMLNSNADIKISIEGHTDNVGIATNNKKLSQDRAKAVMDALIAKGIVSTRMSYQGWGQEKPVADNSTDEGKAKNRRVEIIKL